MKRKGTITKMASRFEIKSELIQSGIDCEIVDFCSEEYFQLFFENKVNLETLEFQLADILSPWEDEIDFEIEHTPFYCDDDVGIVGTFTNKCAIC